MKKKAKAENNAPYEITIELPKEAVQHIVKPYIKPYEEALQDLANRNRALIDNAESEKIKKLESEINDLKKLLRLSVVVLDSEKELKAYKKFCKKHEHLKDIESADDLVAGSVYKHPYIKLGGTGIGMCKTVVCPICGKEQDITDISVW